MNFKPNSTLERAIDSNNLSAIRIAIISYIDKDPADRKNETLNAIKYIESKNINIWQSNQYIEREKSISQWDMDYLSEIQADLSNNFSKERLELALKVGKHIYKDDISSNSGRNGQQSQGVNKTNSYQDGQGFKKSQEKQKVTGQNNKNTTISSSNDSQNLILILILVFGVFGIIFLFSGLGRK
ncbi:MAG: hypothetical protein R3Y64_08550 [Peptostreptococcaceae bacterium]